MSKLPFLLSIPHGGAQTPLELNEITCITRKDLFDDSDPFVIELYDLQDKVSRVIKTDIARAFVDLNRSPDDISPKNPDGLIKSETCYQKPIYKKDKQPDERLKNILIEKYYKPYHDLIQQSMKKLDIQLCFDCHSMASIAPNISPDGNKTKRPVFCISNRDGDSAPNEIVEILAGCISECYGVKRQDIFINNPFHGGYITQKHGNNPLPWIQIEMNRDLYLSEKWFDKESLQMDKSRLSQLNKQFEESLKLLYSKL